MNALLQEQTKELQEALSDLTQYHEQIWAVIKHVKETFDNNKTVYVAGNGGSATLAQHLSDEMVGRYKSNRRPYPVVALTADSAVITCIGNDFGFEHVFSRQLEALGKEGDLFIAYSTSGNSKNILQACEVAREKGMTVIGFTGQSGQLKDVVDYAVVSPAKSTARIQELDLHSLHLICEAFEDPVKLSEHLAEA